MWTLVLRGWRWMPWGWALWLLVGLGGGVLCGAVRGGSCGKEWPTEPQALTCPMAFVHPPSSPVPMPERSPASAPSSHTSHTTKSRAASNPDEQCTGAKAKGTLPPPPDPRLHLYGVREWAVWGCWVSPALRAEHELRGPLRSAPPLLQRRFGDPRPIVPRRS